MMGCRYEYQGQDGMAITSILCFWKQKVCASETTSYLVSEKL